MLFLFSDLKYCFGHKCYDTGFILKSQEKYENYVHITKNVINWITANYYTFLHYGQIYEMDVEKIPKSLHNIQKAV